MPHRTSLIQNTTDSWAAVCEDCPEWMGGDGSKDEAERDAAMHRRGERHPWNPPPGTEWGAEMAPIPDPHETSL